MLKFSADFQQALHHTVILSVTALAVIFFWAFLRIPAGNLLILVFAFLSAVRISDFPSPEIRLKTVAGMLLAAASLQYIVSVTEHIKLLNVLLPAAASGVILKKLPGGSAHPCLLVGMLAYNAAGGVHAATARIIDLLFAGITAWLVTLPLAPIKSGAIIAHTGRTRSNYKIFVESFTIFCAILLYKLLYMKQGLWIVLTIIFIYMSKQANESSADLVRQRIFSVPAGILLGGVYSGTAVMFDYHWAYLSVLIGAVGFFMLYYRHDFFLFTLFFMTAFTICADWMTGTYREFNFLQLLFARSLATVIGAAVLLFIEKAAALQPAKVTNL